MGMLSLCSILFLLYSLSRCSAFPSCLKDQSSALLAFNNSFSIKKPDYSSLISDFCDDYYNQRSYPKTSTWENGTNCCSWDGVTCNTLGHVIGLNLPCCWLHGKIYPNSTLFQFTHLQWLNLAFNDLYGEVPSQISHLHKLVSLDLSWNNLFFQPFQYASDYLSLKPNIWQILIQNLTNIRVLNLSYIDMSSVPPSYLLKNLSSSLVSLQLRYTSLQGNLEDNIRCSPHLQELYLSGNINLTGYLPKSNWNNSLRILSLYRTSFTGELPHSIGLVKSLNKLDLYSCQFVGKIPASISNLTQFSSLDLSSNNFFGEISASLSNLQHLTFLDLSSNNFSGEFPWSLSKLQNLTYLKLANNSFQGHLPNEISGFANLEELDLSHNLLNETIPSWCLTLPSLAYLNLSFNQFTSQIGDISSHSLEYFDLSNNKLNGLIPRSIFYLENLTYLDLSHNFLTGTMQHLPWKNIRYLDLSSNLLRGELNLTLSNLTRFFSVSHNKLTGGISSSICNANSLEILNLSYNNFTGPIPQCVGSSSLALFALDLQMNSFSSTIPETFEVGNNLRTLNLHGNKLEGSLPQSLVNCTKLNVLDLGRNNIEDAFPHWLQTLEELQVLVLRENKLHGSITDFKDKTNYAFLKLRVFDLSSNNLGGPLPTTYFKSFEAMINVHEGEIGLQYMGTNNSQYQYHDSIEVTLKGSDIHLEKILTTFTTIDLSNNLFEGDIPQVIGELGSLKGLNLSHNRLIGAIPKSMENLKNLESLDFSCNKFTGKIPMELTNLNYLEILNLSHNQLEGCIPRGKQFETFTSDSYKGNTGLHGFPISSVCNTDERRKPLSNFVYQFEFEFGWKPVVLGYGCGAILGAIMGWVMILIGKPQWLVSMVERPPNMRKRRARNCGR